MTVVAPGAAIGILGGGQLGRMIAIAAAQLGYRTHIYAPEASGPAADVSPRWTQAAYEDVAALAAFAASVDVVTYEFENVDPQAIGVLAGAAIVRPGAQALRVAQDRLAEKRFVADLGGVTAPFAPVDDLDQLEEALERIGSRAILKTRRMGYDGKGQARLAEPGDAVGAWNAIQRQPAILEGFVTFAEEFSVILVRGADGAVRFWDSAANIHVDGILATSTAPAGPLIQGQLAEARVLAQKVADALDYVGVLACEFFASPDGPVFNEMAPRVHNSGHWTIEGAVTSQFENHVRAICGLPLGDTALAARRVEMRNLIGDQAGEWSAILSDPANHLHLYGKHDARAGRKMGHVTRLTL
ncbi:5-(carboxyamino)imidazole ribonucleotide synthase [Sphingobium sp. AN558]|uniref:5-(carboxyamino)imidazole ribonucleotide synthase n=1 Tax=Sphingobium sp. AN558 TaxID=3133442 RepID=UPI0030BF6B53